MTVTDAMAKLQALAEQGHGNLDLVSFIDLHHVGGVESISLGRYLSGRYIDENSPEARQPNVVPCVVVV